ncbi:MAG TPA: hypothetical protein VL171_07465 [Verrucomicrobiae bacterium]|nr:hypothetical protein [Verrucomicrobiae bacterium]
MNSIQALDPGFAMQPAAQGAQDQPLMADQRLFLWDVSETPRSLGVSARDGLRVNCSNPPNAIKVGASSDRRTA